MLNYENGVLKTRMRWMMADLRDACAGSLDAIRAIGSFDPDEEELEEGNPEDVVDFVDLAEARDVIGRSADIAGTLYLYVCKYAAYALAYEEVVKGCGVDFSKLFDSGKFDARVREICEALKERAAEMVEKAAANERGRA